MESEYLKFNGFFRGKVVDVPSDKSGLIKVFVHGVFPEEYEQRFQNLPYAEPAMSIFGGNLGAASISSYPKKGAMVWVFFDGGDFNRPVYFASCQGAPGWKPEHPKQHVISTDNVRIRIDEDPSNSSSTAVYDSYNQSCVSEAPKVNEIRTRLEVQCTGNVDIVVTGSANVKVTGDAFLEVGGSLSETVKGSKYRKIDGDLVEEIGGNITRRVTGNVQETVTGSFTVASSGSAVVAGATRIGIVYGSPSSDLGMTADSSSIKMKFDQPMTIEVPSLDIDQYT
nr:hypothetical protein [Candidatus Sigynarchaeota archaeon]